MRKTGCIGFAQVYLNRCLDQSKSHDTVDIDVYTQLVALDKKLGTTASEQLYKCLTMTNKWEIIKVTEL